MLTGLESDRGEAAHPEHQFPSAGEPVLVYASRVPQHPQDEARHVMCPKPVMPAIAAFTPHVDQMFGVTVAEYEVDLGK